MYHHVTRKKNLRSANRVFFFYCYVQFAQQTAFLHNIKLSLFITEMENVYARYGLNL